MTVFLSEHIHPDARKALEAVCTVVDNFDHPDEIDAIILRTFPVDASVMDRCKNLKVIGKHGVGCNTIDLEAAKEKGIYVSAGSACSSNKLAVSHTLKSMGVEKDLLGSTIRFSFCFETTEEETDYCVRKLRELLPMLRRYVRR